MTMRLAALALVAWSLASINVQPAEAAGEGARPSGACSGTQHAPIAADARGEIYAVRARPSRVLYGCLYRSRHVYRLGPAAYRYQTKYDAVGFYGLRREVMSGPLVAFEEVSIPICCGKPSWVVIVRDLRSGRVLRREPTGTTSAGLDAVGTGPITALVLRSDGAFAWITDASVLDGPIPKGGYQVHAADASGSRLLASGEEIEPRSLALSDTAIYWGVAGMPFSASLR